MPRFTEQFVQQVLDSVDIVELVGQYVALTHRGREFVGLCPFHDDKKPSLNVSPSKQIFKCFSCGAGGDALKFLTLYEKYSFPEAVRALADRSSIPLPQESLYSRRDEEPQAGMSKRDLLGVTAFAAEFYQRQLHTPAGASTLQYARDRGFTDESIERFALGYAPDSWDALLSAAGSKGISTAQLLTAGLIAQKEGADRCYDRFRHRLMFPIYDLTGSVIAFGGRALRDEERAKYLNSPESILFDKSSQLYAMNWAREKIVSGGTAVVVEGYLDALIPLQAGVGNVVASLGTALTERHVRLLGRYAREVVLVFDADQAGAAAAERAMEVFLAQQVGIRVATVPAGKDPCDYCLAEGPEAFEKLVAEAPDAMQYAWDLRLGKYRAAGGNPADRHKVAQEFLRLIATSAAYGAIDDMRRGQLAQHIGHILNIPASELQRQMQRLARQTRRAAAVSAPAAALNTEMITRDPERIVLEVLLNNSELFHTVSEKLQPADFTSGELRQIAEKIWALGHDDRLTLQAVMSDSQMHDLADILSDMTMAGQIHAHGEQALAAAMESLLQRHSDRDIQKVRGGDLDDEALRKLTNHHKEADPRRLPKIN
ncbi:MAG: DNA primase [Phycisphaerae bacterium]|nr:DNA primase [Phycisphaerae bacterium]